MPAKPIRERLIPYKILVYLLYTQQEFVQHLKSNEIRVHTGPASRALRIKSVKLWEALFWIQKQGLVDLVSKEEKRGSVRIRLKQPTNIPVIAKGTDNENSDK